MIDLRSDTVTRPSQGMMDAMIRASVGDDVYQEDPAVNELQEYTAEITGMEASIFMPTGCMANLTALYILGGRGNEVLCHPSSHIMQYELASPAVVAGVMIVPVEGERGTITAEGIGPFMKRKGALHSYPTLVTIENSANKAGGTCYSEKQLLDLREITEKHGLKLHMDGARAFNAAIAAGVPVKTMAANADSLSLCLSKGLGAPAGTMLCGSAEYIEEARRVRKMLGGGMRQSGFYAAAGLYALRNNTERLEEDHRHARIIAEAISACSWADTDPASVETNIVMASTAPRDSEEIVSILKEHGVLANAMGAATVRFVTHLDLDDRMIETAAEIIRGI